MNDTSDVNRDAHAVLLPVLDGLTLPPWASHFLRSGGRGLVLGMTRAEYLARQMSEIRIQRESADDVRRLAVEAEQLAGGPVLLAADAEIGGIGRLHRLVPALPTADQVTIMSSAEIRAASHAVARAARDVGISLFLAPVADVVEDNHWLEGRQISGGAVEVGRVVSAFIEGANTGGVRTTVKHFPGHPSLPRDPAISVVSLKSTPRELGRSLYPFRLAVRCGVSCVMVGPVAVDGIDPDVPAAMSRPVIEHLRRELGFRGVVMSDDLSSASTLRGLPIEDVAVRSLDSGVDLLLVPGNPDLARISSRLIRAVEHGGLSAVRLNQAAGRVRGLR